MMCSTYLPYYAIHIYHTTAKYMPVINMSLKCHMPKILDVHQGESMPVSMPLMNSVAYIMWQEVLYTDNYNADANNTS